MFLPCGVEWRKSDYQFLFPNGATLKLRHIERTEDADDYQGHQYAWIGWDELTHWATDEAYKKLFACCRWTSAPISAKRIRATANPGGPGHHWVKQRFIDPAPGGFVVIEDPATGHTRMFIPARVHDNKILLDKDPNYINMLKGIGSPELVRAWLDGDWNVVVGAYFTEFGVKHICRPFNIPSHWLKFRAFDWGSARPFGCLWIAVADGVHYPRIPKGSLVVYRELYGGENNVGWKWTAEQVAEAINRLEAQTENISFTVADTAIFTADGGPSIAERMRRAVPGLNLRPSDKRRLPGWDQVRERLRGDSDGPRLFVFSTCKNLIRTLPLLQHDQHNLEDVDSDGDDHLPDCLRYGCMTRPWVNAPPRSEPIRDYTRASLDELFQAQEREERMWR